MAAKPVYTEVYEFGKLSSVRFKRMRDMVIAIDGGRGSGKSTLAYELAERNAKETGTVFDPMQHVIYDIDEFFEYIDGEKQLPPNSAIIIDEAVNIAFSKTWYSQQQIALVKLLNTCRDKFLLIIFCLPNFWDLDGGVRNLIDYRIKVQADPKFQGMSTIYKASDADFTADKWFKAANEKLEKKKMSPWRFQGYVGNLRFKPLSQKKYDLYWEVRNKKRTEAIEKLRREGDKNKVKPYRKLHKQRDNLVRHVYDKGFMNQREIAEVMELERTAVTNLVNGYRGV